MRSYDLNGTIIYNGKSSADLGVIVRKLPVIRKPKRKGSTTAIPGRSGALAREEGGFENYVQPYEISITDTNRGISAISGDLAAWLLNTRGYLRLEDSFDPDVYRLARFAGPFDIEPLMEDDGKAVIEFDCQPQRYLRSGEQEIEITEELTTLYNPTAFAASPLIRVEMQSEAEEITPTVIGADDMTWSYGYIGNKQMNPSVVHTVISSSYTNNSVSNAIDVSGYESAIISTICVKTVHNPSGQTTYGLGMATCYTFYTSAAKPVSKVVDFNEMDGVTIPIPKGAKWLYICVANNSSGRIMEPSVTLIPALPTAGTGSVTINGKQATIEFADRSTIYLDCETHNAYFEDGSNANPAVTFTEADNAFPTFPVLEPGDNQISMSASEDSEISASIVPRWWTL